MPATINNSLEDFAGVVTGDTLSGDRVNMSDTLEDAAAWDESDAVRRAQAGDSQAFAELYEMHVGRIYAVCLRMLSDAERLRKPPKTRSSGRGRPSVPSSSRVRSVPGCTDWE